MRRGSRWLRQKEKFRVLDQSPFEAVMANYASPQMSAEPLEAKFAKDADDGYDRGGGQATVWSGQSSCGGHGSDREARRHSVRPLHDAAHGVNLNNKIE